MAGTGGSHSASSSGQLPTPKVQLVGTVDTASQTVEHSNGTGFYNLRRYPIVSAQDLTQTQIDQGVYVEMLHYRPHKSPTTAETNARESGYVVPVAQIGGVNPLAGIGSGWTRGGSYTSSADRPNHYRVNAQNEQIPVWEYLKNRHFLFAVSYQNTANVQASVNLLIPTTNWRYANYAPGRTFGYSGRYRPYYFCFRYIMFDEAENQWVSSSLSKIVKLAHRVHPFRRDYAQSGVFGQTVNSIDPNFNVGEMACWFETRLPGGAGA